MKKPIFPTIEIDRKDHSFSITTFLRKKHTDGKYYLQEFLRSTNYNKILKNFSKEEMEEEIDRTLQHIIKDVYMSILFGKISPSLQVYVYGKEPKNIFELDENQEDETVRLGMSVMDIITYSTQEPVRTDIPGAKVEDFLPKMFRLKINPVRLRQYGLPVDECEAFYNPDKVHWIANTPRGEIQISIFDAVPIINTPEFNKVFDKYGDLSKKPGTDLSLAFDIFYNDAIKLKE